MAILEGSFDESIMTELLPEAAAQAKARGQARDLQQTAEEVMAELECMELVNAPDV